MKKRGFIKIVLVILLILIIPNITALSLQGQTLSPIIFEPGKTISNHYSIFGTDKEVEVSLEGEMVEYMEIKHINKEEIELNINFPRELPESKSYAFSLSVREKGEAANGMGSLVSVTKNFRIEVYSHEKEISASLSAPNVNVGTPLHFRLSVTSRGYQDINAVKGEITIYDYQNNSLAAIETDEKPLKSLASEELKAVFDTEELTAGDYHAKAIIIYDGKEKTAFTNFKIGHMDLIITNYTAELARGYNDFIIKVKNNWGNELRNVYALLFINDSLILQTPNLNKIAPWEEAELKAIAKIEQTPGEYLGKIVLYFEGEQKEVSIKIKIIEPVKNKTMMIQNIIQCVLGGVVLVIVLSIIMKFITKRKKEKEDEEL